MSRLPVRSLNNIVLIEISPFVSEVLLDMLHQHYILGRPYEMEVFIAQDSLSPDTYAGPLEYNIPGIPVLVSVVNAGCCVISSLFVHAYIVSASSKKTLDLQAAYQREQGCRLDGIIVSNILWLS